MSSAVPHQSSQENRTTAVLPVSIRSTLDALRSVLSRFVLCQAFVQWAIGMLAAYWLFGFVDYLPAAFGSAESPAWIRIIMLGLLAAGTLHVLYHQLWKRWLVRWSDDALALLIERKYPEFQSSLVTTVQASKSPIGRSATVDHPHRPGFLALAQKQALELLPRVEVAKLVRSQPLQWQLGALGGMLALSIVLVTLYPNWVRHWNQRLFTLANTPWPRAVVLGVEGIEFEVPSFTGTNSSQRYLLAFRENSIAVPAGQSGVLKSFAALDAKSVPELCTVYFRDEDGNRGRANMRRLTALDGKQPFLLDGPPLEGMNQSLWLSIAGGDARISNLYLDVVQPPLITEVQLKVAYPTYLQRSTQSRFGEEILPYRTGMRIPQGSEITLLIDTNKEVLSCDFISLRSDKVATSSEIQKLTLESPSSKLEVPLGVLETNMLMEFRLWDTFGICSSRVQQFVFSATVDQAPQVDMILDGIGTSVTENVVIPVQGKVKDEYDVQSTWLEVVAGEGQTIRFNVDHSVDGEVEYQIDMKEQRDSNVVAINAGSTVALTLAADDYFDLTDEPQIGKSATAQLSVVTPDQLLLLLDRREAAMRKRLEQIIGEVGQLRDLLVNVERREAGELVAPVPTTVDDQPVTETEEQRIERILRIQLLRSQQAISQISKSGSELTGVEKEIAQIAKELINNRIDSVDRRTRWQEKIQLPLHRLLDESWQDLLKHTQSLEKSFSRGVASANSSGDSKSTPLDSSAAARTEETAPTSLTDPSNASANQNPPIKDTIVQAIKANDESLARLQSILADMLEIQDQTAIIDMLREIIDNSNSLIEETKDYKKEQDRKALDFLR